MSQRGHSHRSEAGMVFLLQSYLTIFWFVVLTAAMLTRSSMELRYAQLALEEHQAFWQAEAGVDETLYGITTNPPVLAANHCTRPTDQLLSLSSATGYAYTYQVCLNDSGQYAIVSIGQGRTSAIEELSSMAARPDTTLQFRQAVLAVDQIEIRQATFGSLPSIFTQLGSGSTVLPSFSALNSQAHLVALAKQLSGAAVNLSARSYVKGNVVLPPGLSSSAGLVIENESHLTNEQGTSDVKTLEDRVVLPEPVAAPNDAVNLGSLELNGSTRCLAPGTYRVANVILRKNIDRDPVLCTTGPVNLYVTGTFRQEAGKLYGQPSTDPLTLAGISGPLNRFSPKHLRIFVTSTQEVKFGNGLSAAVVYAPLAHVIVGEKQVFLGSLIAKLATIGSTGAGNRTYFFYDQALEDERFSVNTSGSIALQAQQAVAQASASNFAIGTTPFRVISGFDASSPTSTTSTTCASCTHR